MLTELQIEHFITDGFVKIEKAFPEELAATCRAILWSETRCNPDDPSTWAQAVIRLGDYDLLPFRQAANTSILHEAFDQLVGTGRWIPRESLGSFPVRFPSTQDPIDTGWHVDASFAGEDASDFMRWRINLKI